MRKKITEEEIQVALLEMGEKAQYAGRKLATLSPKKKNAALKAMGDALEAATKDIIHENKKDLKAGEKNGLSKAMIDRLRLDKERIKAIADGLREVAALEDPVGRDLSTIIRPNGLEIKKVSVPIGVIGIIFESRPNVTVDAAGLCLKAGNAVILRGGKEAIHSNLALANCINRAGLSAGLPDGVVQLIPWIDRVAVTKMVKMDNYIDLIIPRGGEGLIRTVVEQATIPVIKHYKGVCNLYIDKDADIEMGLAIAENAKCQRPGVCNAIENLLIHKDIASKFAKKLFTRLSDAGVELRGDLRFQKLCPKAHIATEEDWFEEYLDLVLSVKIIDSTEEAVDWINKHSSGHSDSIISEDKDAVEYFLNNVDSATVYVNASTRFTDGFEFGMGAEIGISTDKLHARGPMGLEELTTYKYLVYGDGQIRS